MDIELNKIQQTPAPYEQFFNYWTKKEAVIKADGRSLNIPLKKINVAFDVVWIKNKKWHLLYNVLITNEYSCHLALDTNMKTIFIDAI